MKEKATLHPSHHHHHSTHTHALSLSLSLIHTHTHTANQTNNRTITVYINIKHDDDSEDERRKKQTLVVRCELLLSKSFHVCIVKSINHSLMSYRSAGCLSSARVRLLFFHLFVRFCPLQPRLHSVTQFGRTLIKLKLRPCSITFTVCKIGTAEMKM